MSFYNNDGELSCSDSVIGLNLLSEENYIEYRHDYDIISSNKLDINMDSFINKYISLLSGDETDGYSIFKASYRNKMLFITVITILLIKACNSFALKDCAQELLNLFFLKLPLLGYDSDIRNDLVPQDLLGLLRSEYLSNSHLQMARKRSSYFRKM